MNASISLTRVGNKFYLYDSNGTGPALKYAGTDFVAGQFGDWTPIAAVATAHGYEIAWKVAGADAYTAWSTDFDGNYIASIIGYAVSGSDYSLETLETNFHQDLNGNGTIGPAPIVIQVNGSTSLTVVAAKFYLHDGNGNGPTLKYDGADVVAGQFGAWTPIGAVETLNGYDVAWRVTGADQYVVWTTDLNGNYVAAITGYAVSGTDYSLQALEATFHQDLNADGAILIQTNGSTSLVEVANKFYLRDNTGVGPSLKYGNADYGSGQFGGGWAPIGAVKTATGYDVAWKVAGADQYVVWSTDLNGNYVASITGYAVSGTDYSLQALEATFHQDFNHDGTLGPVSTLVQVNGSTNLTEVANKFYLSDGSGTTTTLKYYGVEFFAGQFGGWTPIGAVETATGYDVAWKVAGSDEYTVWRTDINGNYIAAITGYAVPGNDSSLQALEGIFQQDLNGDGIIVRQVNGSTTLTEAANKFYLSDGSGTGLTLKYAGSDFVMGQFGGWTPIGAVKTANGYDVAWKVAGADEYTVWSTDLNGNYVAAITGYAVSSTDSALQALEPTFHQDLNGDGVLGVYTPGTLSLQYKGFAYISSYNGAFADANSLPALAETGANAIEATLGYGIDVTTSRVVADPNYTESLAALGQTIAAADNLGLSVMVRPLIGFLDPDKVAPYSVGDWRQNYHPTDVSAFFASYKQMLVAEAEVAQRNGAEMVCIGAELDQLAGSQYLSYWTDIISSVRAVFGGELTYSANWNTATQVSFWSQLDYQGIDCYLPLSHAQNPTLQDLIDGWLQPPDPSTNPIAYAAMGNLSPIQYFEHLAAQSGKPLLFTEIGYANDAGAAAQPWASGNSPAPNLQAALYEAFFQAWSQSGSHALQGAYFWAWHPDSSTAGPGINSFSPQNSPAQNEATAGFETRLEGDAGDNVLTAGSGIYTLTGGGGIDTFVFPENSTCAIAGKRDTITDFVAGIDKIDLTAIDSHFGSGIHGFKFIGSAAFDGHAGELRYSYDAAHDVTILEADTAGGKTPSFEIALTGKLTLTAADFTADSVLIPVNLLAGAGTAALSGGPLDDTLNDGGVAALMIGGAGNDTYLVSNAADFVVETAGIPYAPPSGWTVKGTADFNKDGNLDVLLSSGTANEFQLLSSSGAVVSTVAAVFWEGWQLLGTLDHNHDGNPDVLFQRNGSSQQEVNYLDGMSWNGRYAGASGITPDALKPLPGENHGIDTVQASISYTLPNEVENLTLASGAGNINATGNALSNVLIGNEGNNSITGGAGNDTLTGGGGNDTFVFGPNFGKDSISDFQYGDTIAIDHTVFASVSAILAALGTDAQGNATITANANDVITVDHVSASFLQQHSDALQLT